MSVSSKVRHGIIGAGMWSAVHIDAIKRLNNVSLAFITDLDPERVAQLSDQGLPAVPFDDRLLDTATVDSVSIVTPDDTHPDLVQSCMQAGISALVEKPLGVDPETVESLHSYYHRLVEERRKPIRINVNFHNRFCWPVLDLNLSLQNRILGRVLSLDADIATTTAQLESRAWLQRSSPLHFLGSHTTDLLMWLMQPSIVRVRAWGLGTSIRDRGFSGYDVYSVVFIADDSQLARMTVSLILPDTCPSCTRFSVECTATDGYASANLTDSGLLSFASKSSQWNSNCLVRGAGSSFGPAPVPGFAQISVEAFLSSTGVQSVPLATLCDGYNACMVLAAIESSIAEGSEITVRLCRGVRGDS